MLKEHTHVVECVAFSKGIKPAGEGPSRTKGEPSGLLLASGSRDKSIKIWDTQTGQCTQTLVRVLTRGHCRIEANEVTVGARQLGARRDVPPYQSMAHQRVGRQEHPRVGLEGRSLLPDTARRTRSLHHVRHFAIPPVLTPIRCLDYNSKDSTLATAGIDDVIRIFPCR